MTLRQGAKIALLLLATCLVVGQLSAQQAESSIVSGDTLLTTVRRLEGTLVRELPVDSVDDALLLLPGITGQAGGDLSLRGGTPGGANVYLDGIPVRSGFSHGAATAVLVERARPGLSLGTNGIGRADIVTGPLGPEYGNARDGVVLLRTREAPDRWAVEASYQTGEVFGATHDPGLNRLQGSVAGRLGRGLHLMLVGTLQGQRSPDSGPGSNRVPIFTQAGIDTVVAVPSAILDPLADTTYVPIDKFAVYRGACGMFAESVNPDIAGNAGRSCHGIRLPDAQRTDYQALGRLDYRLGAGSRLFLLGMANQHQARQFDYNLLYNPAALDASREWSRMLGVSYRFQGLLHGHAATLRAFVSYQADRALAGPLASQPSPALGWMIGGLDFRWNFSNFPINDELITNIRENIPSSRRSPYELENRDQYSYIDQYRNDAYGLTGFVESGGPLGRLTMFRENRSILGGSTALALSRALTLRAGADYTASSLDNYDHALASQAYADAWRVKPRQTGLWIASQLETLHLTLDVGLRYDHFRSGAARPYVLDTVATSLDFGTYSYFPRPNSYGTGGATLGGMPLVLLVPDRSHSVLSPRIRLGTVLGATRLHAGYARETEVPRFQDLYTGINTDLSITSTNQIYGTDLGFERQDVMEFGAARQLTPRLTLDVTAYYKSLGQAVTPGLVSLRDPQRLGASVDLRTFTMLDGGSVTGMEIALEGRIGRYLRGLVGYSYADAKTANDLPTPASRPHSLAGAVALTLPPEWHAGSLAGALLGRTSVLATFHYSSGAPYTRCPTGTGNEFVLSGEVCAGALQGDLFASRLPAFSQVDLRLARDFALAGHTVRAFLDARNLLNRTNTQAVFATTGTTTNDIALQLVWAVDSAGLANEGKANGVYNSATGDIDLGFGGAMASGCGNWVNAQAQPSAPNCVYLIRAEQRYGNGDGILNLAEQRRASDALARVSLGSFNFEGPPRRLRLGLQISL